MALSLSLLFVVLATATLSQAEEIIATLDEQYLMGNWAATGTVSDFESANACQWMESSNSRCVRMTGGSTLTGTISTAGYHSIRLVLDVSEVYLAIDSSESCTLSYRKDESGNWSTIEILYGEQDYRQNVAIDSIPDSYDYNNQSFQVRLANADSTSENKKCYFDNLEIWGIPYTHSPIADPTREPSLTPTTEPTSQPTAEPSTSEPSTDPTLSPTVYLDSTIVLTSQPSQNTPLLSSTDRPTTLQIIQSMTSSKLTTSTAALLPDETTATDHSSDKSLAATAIISGISVAGFCFIVLCIMILVFYRNKFMKTKINSMCDVKDENDHQNGVELPTIPNQEERRVASLSSDIYKHVQTRNVAATTHADRGEAGHLFGAPAQNEATSVIVTAHGAGPETMNNQVPSTSTHFHSQPDVDEDEDDDSDGDDLFGVHVDNQPTVKTPATTTGTTDSGSEESSDDDNAYDAREDRAYETWRWQQILQWIVLLENGRYMKYKENLQTSLHEEAVIGAMLDDVDKGDLKGWGVVNFQDKHDLFVSIQHLINPNVQEGQ